MRTITTETNLYKYDELNANAQANVKQWYLDNFREPSIFSGEVADDLEVILGKNNLDVEYSLSHSQGDGLNIYGDISVTQILDAAEKNENGITMLDDFNNTFSEHDKETIRAYAEVYGTVHVPYNKSFYSYCVADQIDYAGECETELEYNEYKNVNTDVLAKLNDALIELFTELCKMYEELGYDYFYEVDDEYLSEECDGNGWEFEEDGTIY